MSLDLIRAEYKTIMETIPNIGVVHEYSRLATDWTKFLELFKDPATEKILGWEITRESTAPVQKYISGVSPGAFGDRPSVMLIRGYKGLQDASATEEDFQALIDAILNKFLPLPTLNGQALNTSEMVASLLSERQFGGVLCHYAELRQTVWERITY